MKNGVPWISILVPVAALTDALGNHFGVPAETAGKLLGYTVLENKFREQRSLIYSLFGNQNCYYVGARCTRAASPTILASISK